MYRLAILRRSWQPARRGTLFVLAMLLVAPAAARAGVLRLDVAMNGTTFHFQGPTTPSGVPADGTPFVVRGYIYPGGTLAARGRDGGVLADGSPEFPELVLGSWICQGFHLADGDATTGPIVSTTQIFDLSPPDRPGSRTIVTHGIELADFFVPFRRAITGGTGPWAGASGPQVQNTVGFNPSGGFNNVFELRIQAR